MRDSFGYEIDCEAFRIADCLFRSRAVRHYTRKLDRLCYPAPVLFQFEFDRELHTSNIAGFGSRALRTSYTG